MNDNEILKIIIDHKNETAQKGLFLVNEINIIRTKLSQMEADNNAFRGAIQSAEFLIKKIEGGIKQNEPDKKDSVDIPDVGLVSIEDLKKQIFKNITEEENKQPNEQSNGVNTEFSAEKNLLNDDDSVVEN